MNRVHSNVLFMPAFPDGELVPHFLRRLCHGAHSLSAPPASMGLLDTPPVLNAMPNDLARFHCEFGHLYGTIDELLDRHTLCDLHCCGLPVDRIGLQRARLKRKLFTPTRLSRLPVVLAPTEWTDLRCPECEVEQEREYGFSFTHRCTEPPFVEVCGIHETALRIRSEDACPYEACRRNVPSNRQQNMALEYSRRVCVAVEMPAAQSQYHKDSVAERLLVSGWASPARRVYFDDLLPRFSFFFKDAFSDGRLAQLVERPELVDTAVRALFRGDRSVHPVWCVLMLWFAENCWRERCVRESRPSSRRCPRIIKESDCARDKRSQMH
ncbi:hypothetical protein ABH945_003709 [Paraburkholderia sp. GAS333]